MRKLTDHIVSGDQAVQLEIEVHDEPSTGGANNAYVIYGFHTKTNAAAGESPFHKDETCTPILFQNGPIPQVGANGITGEALIAIEIDRLRGFQSGPFACRENAIALTHFEEGLMWLQRRTVSRIKRGVEGTYAK